MADQNSPNETERNPSMKIVKWLILIAIGIPVIIEVGTFLGMLGKQMEEKETPAEVLIDRGDLLRSGVVLSPENQSWKVRVEHMQLWASPGDWKLQMDLKADTTTLKDQTIVMAFDSLITNKQTVLDSRIEVSFSNENPSRQLEWTLPSGEQPAQIRITWEENGVKICEFGKIPTRIMQE